MTKREIAALICKVLGLYLIVFATQHILFDFTTLASKFGEGSITFGYAIRHVSWVFLPFALLIVVGVLFWMMSERLALRMISATDFRPVQTKITPEDIQRVAFSVIGLYVLVTAIPQLIGTAIGSVTEADPAFPRSNTATVSRIVAQLTQATVGLFLFFGSGKMARLLNKSRQTDASQSSAQRLSSEKVR